jgi:hypothetical protein
VVVVPGVTGNEIELDDVTVGKFVVPSVYVKDHGAVPVSVIVMLVVEPAQMDVVPVIVAPGPAANVMLIGVGALKQPL